MAEYVYDYTPNKQHRHELIVRCRDCASVCKHYEGMDVWWCEYLQMYVGSSDFCAWGVRRAEA